MKPLDASRDFKKKAAAVLEDRTKSQLIVEILAGLESTPTILPALHATSKVIIGEDLRSSGGQLRRPHVYSVLLPVGLMQDPYPRLGALVSEEYSSLSPPL